MDTENGTGMADPSKEMTLAPVLSVVMMGWIWVPAGIPVWITVIPPSAVWLTTAMAPVVHSAGRVTGSVGTTMESEGVFSDRSSGERSAAAGVAVTFLALRFFSLVAAFSETGGFLFSTFPSRTTR